MPNISIKVLNFEGAFNLPLWVAEERGLFERHGLAVTTDYTRGSVDMVGRLSTGEAQIALTSVDNVIAYSSGQGESGGHTSLDLVAFMGGDRGFLSLVSSAGITSINELRGKKVAVDAITTGFAFALRRMLDMHGVGASEVDFVAAGGTGNRYRQLAAGQFDATLLRTPFEVLSLTHGFNVLATANDMFPGYLGTVGAARRGWIDAHRDEVKAFMLAYREALKWIFDANNRRSACAILRRRFDEISEADIQAVYADLVDPERGLILDMSIPDKGIEQVRLIRDAATRHDGPSFAPTCVDLELLMQVRESTQW
ncbi:hypothetical protein CR51_41735 [Caballeronia megalochromosomata]|jgi:ABC-type nitrate/sulfonate/bicarbonate transport system substrate-binding protein|nr:hypothetical protein CR51_41735 [Caballeronia megalochromosomata]